MWSVQQGVPEFNNDRNYYVSNDRIYEIPQHTLPTDWTNGSGIPSEVRCNGFTMQLKIMLVVCFEDFFETTEKVKLTQCSFPKILGQNVFTSTMVLNLGECNTAPCMQRIDLRCSFFVSKLADTPMVHFGTKHKHH